MVHLSTNESDENQNRSGFNFQTPIKNNTILNKYLEEKFSKPTVDTVNDNKVMINNQTYCKKFNSFSEEAQKIITCMVSKKLLEKAIRSKKSILSEDDEILFEKITDKIHHNLAKDNINLDKSETNYDLDTSSLEHLEASLIKISNPYLPEKQEKQPIAIDTKTIKQIQDKLLER